jgi:hypothetical protein
MLYLYIMDSGILETLDITDTTPSQETQFTLKTYEYKKGIPTYKASIVDLTLVAIVSLNNIDGSTKFGAEFHKLSGNQISQFLDLICEMYDAYSISDPHSGDYRTSYNFWFSEIPLKRRVKYAELHLDDAIHKLNLLLNVLIIQLRTKLDGLKKAHLSSDFSESLINGLETLLNFLPPQQQKEIVITDRKENVGDDGTLPIKTVLITYEPFIEYVNASFNEASKLKRLGNVDDKNTNNVERINKKKEFNTVSNTQNKNNNNNNNKNKKRVQKTEADSDGWIVQKNGKNKH